MKDTGAETPRNAIRGSESMAIENEGSADRVAAAGTAPGRCSASRLRGPLALAAASAFILAATADPAFGLRLGKYPDCGDLCSKEFWSSAGGNDVASAFRRDPTLMSYRGHILRNAVSSGAESDAVAALLRAGAPLNTRRDRGDRRTVLQEAVLLGTEAQGADGGRHRLTREEAVRRRRALAAMSTSSRNLRRAWIQHETSITGPGDRGAA